MIALLLIGMLTLTFNVQTIRANETVGFKDGDWIKYDYIFSADIPPGTPFPEWMKVEFLSVEGTTATACITLHMSDGTEQNQTMTGDLVTGEVFSGFVIPVNSTTGDSIYIGGYGYVTIAGETRRTYAGASRTVVYASFSQYETQLTYYWDKQTGVLVEASVVLGGITGAAKATETNMWQTSTIIINVDPQCLEVYIGEPFTVNINITNVEDPGLYGYQLFLCYDNTTLQGINVELPEDHFLASNNLFIVELEIFQNEGYASVAMILLGDEPAKTGSGLLATVQFSGISVGSVLLEIEDVILLGPDGNELAYSVNDAEVTVISDFEFDLNGDGKVDIQDVAVVASTLGSYSGHPRWNPIADVNRDNKVNIIDIVLIAKNFGK